MLTQHYYQILLLLGSLLIAPLHAAHAQYQDDHKGEQSPANKSSGYTHGDLSFIDREKHNVNQKGLKQGHIDLPQRIKAKGRRKDYYFTEISSARTGLPPLDNPISQYIGDSIQDFSVPLAQAIQPLLVIKRKIDSIEKKLDRMANAKVIEKALKNLEKDLRYWHNYQNAIETDNTLEVVFSESHYEILPAEQGWWRGFIEWTQGGYKLCKTFRCPGAEPIYKILATYGPEAELRECHAAATANRFEFIEKHFSITERTDSSGIVTFEAIANDGIGVKNGAWCLYHATTGQYKPQCNITFYALKRERLATQVKLKYIKGRIKELQKDIDVYKVKRKDNSTLLSVHK